jgi:hypothetical protein
MISRWPQQLRLWIYTIIEALLVYEGASGGMTAIDFTIFVFVGALFFLEVCPVCGRLVWWETNRWPNALWISSQCRASSSTES